MTTIAVPASQTVTPRRMSLTNITRGRVERPYRLVVYGPPGVGKTTFGASAPDPIFLPVERGSDELDVARLPMPTCWQDVMDGIQSLTEDEHEFRSVVIDTLDHAELLLHDHIVRSSGKTSMAEAHGGYGKAYGLALNAHRELAQALERLQYRRNVNVILLAHSTIRQISNPAGDDYSAYGLKLYDGRNANSCAFWTEWANDVLFLSDRVMTRSVKVKEQDQAKGVASERVIYTQRQPFAEAKTRHKIPAILPLTIERPFGVFDDAVTAARPVTLDAAIEAIPPLIALLPEDRQARATAHFASIQTDASALSTMLAHLRADTGGVRA